MRGITTADHLLEMPVLGLDELGFNDSAKLDDGNLWPITYALAKLTETEEKKIAQLVKKAVS